MSNEASIRSSLQIKVGEIVYQSQPTSFLANVATPGKGPTPGAISVSTGGTDVNFSQLVQPGLCRIMNLDPTNWVEYGVYDSDTTTYLPLGEILPGETYILRLSRQLGSEYGAGPGTGTIGHGTTLRLRANVASANVLVEAFES